MLDVNTHNQRNLCTHTDPSSLLVRDECPREIKRFFLVVVFGFSWFYRWQVSAQMKVQRCILLLFFISSVWMIVIMAWKRLSVLHNELRWKVQHQMIYWCKRVLLLVIAWIISWRPFISRFSCAGLPEWERNVYGVSSYQSCLFYFTFFCYVFHSDNKISSSLLYFMIHRKICSLTNETLGQNPPTWTRPM